MLPFTGRQLSEKVFEPKLPFYAFNNDKLTYFLKKVNCYSELTQYKKRNIINKIYQEEVIL